MLILKTGETCPYSTHCPYIKSGNSYCQGTNSNRGSQFSCSYVDNRGNFNEGGQQRTALDKTGKMQIITE